jgi:low affinity Fe/Cu permease
MQEIVMTKRARSKAKTTQHEDSKAEGPANVQAAFGEFAARIARIAGMPGTFFGVVVGVVVWAVSGLFVQSVETWLLLINTAGTIVTALMVFLIQNTQYRDTMALQLKLAELILVMEGAENKMALAEDLSHEDLESLKKKLRGEARKAR